MSSPALPLADLIDVVRTLSADPSLWRPHLRFDTAARQWARLPSPDGVDVWLLTWLPGQSTELHDHGEAAAAFSVLSGAVDEVRAGPDGRLHRTRLQTGDSQWVAPGVVHDIVGSETGPAASLHAYSPRLTSMTFWSTSKRGLVRQRTVATVEPELAATA